MVRHSFLNSYFLLEAIYFIRKQIVEKARTFWAKELKDIIVTDVLVHSSKKMRVVEQMFEEDLIKIGFNFGEMYTDTNLKILYKTFLKKDDPRLISPMDQR